MFRSKKNNRLSQKEAEAALARIRQKYDDYIITYMLSPDEKRAFEDRYIQALHARVDLTRFIQDEIKYIQQLHDRAEQDSNRPVKKKHASRGRKKGFADRIMDELEQKISHYPSVDFHTDASPEVCKLYGALGELYQLYWADLSEFIRKVHSSTMSYNLENRLIRMTVLGEDQVPTELERYLFLLQHPGRLSSELFREAQECIKRASFFLHDLRIILQECRDRGIIDERVEKAFEYVENIISDFRLKDLKKI